MVDVSQNVKTVTPPELDGIRGGFTLSPTKRFLALADVWGIYVFEISTGKLERIANLGYSPIWSSDEKWIIFHSQENGVHPIDQVYAINLENKKIYVPDRVAHNIPTYSWSPTNTSIVFEANIKEGINYSTDQTGIYTYDITREKGDFVLKDSDLSYFNPNISPNGKYILYEEHTHLHKGTKLILAKLTPQVNTIKVLYTGKPFYWNPIWSEDSKRFMTNGYGDSDILIFDYLGNQVDEIMMKEWVIQDMTWGENGIIYILRFPDEYSPYSTFSQIVEINLRTKHEKVLYESKNAIYLP